MRLIDFFPSCGAFAPDQRVGFIVEVESASPAAATLRISITYLTTPVATLNRPTRFARGGQRIVIEWQAPSRAPRGYGAKVELLNESGVVDSASSAFDVLPHWTAFPRYGFLTDFSPGRANIDETIASLSRFHLNGLQFYDWQYRHDSLLPPETDYVDPLGRPLSLETVRGFITAAHTQGMAAMPYVAVYAASVDYWRAHSQEALYDTYGHALSFGENFLGLMNPAPGGRWARHLLDECGRVLASLSFDGLHVDQYGDPKTAFDAVGQPVDLPAAFAGFVNAHKTSHPTSTVIFNAVGNWPIEALAASPQDFAYIEIWPPATRYQDVARIVTEARVLSGGKPVVIALYLPAERLANICLADAIIFSCGGTRIELGERERLLAGAYFPKHQPLTPDLKTALRRHYDFVVRYGDLIGPAAGHAFDCEIETLEGLWSTARISEGWLTVCLVNMTGLSEPRWDVAHPAPARLADIPVRATTPGRVREAWWASPDLERIDLSPVSIQNESGAVSLTLPRLDYWAFVALRLDSES